MIKNISVVAIATISLMLTGCSSVEEENLEKAISVCDAFRDQNKNLFTDKGQKWQKMHCSDMKFYSMKTVSDNNVEYYYSLPGSFSNSVIRIVKKDGEWQEGGNMGGKSRAPKPE
jgi:hypothetical protein